MLQNEELAFFPVWTKQHKKKFAITKEYSVFVFASAGRFGQFVTFKRFHFLGWGERRINKRDNTSSISFYQISGVKLESFVLPVSQCMQQSRLMLNGGYFSVYKMLSKDNSHLPLFDNCSGENTDFMIIFSCYSFVSALLSM